MLFIKYKGLLKILKLFYICVLKYVLEIVNEYEIKLKT